MKLQARTHLLLGLLVVTTLALFIYGAQQQGRLVNTDRMVVDQHSYIDYAISMRDSGYQAIGERNRMPLYPFIQSVLYQPGMSKDAFFERGKQLNVALAVLLLIGLLPLLRRFLPLWPTLNLWGIVAFTLFMFKAPYFQAELLFYSLNFLVFLMLSRFLLPDEQGLPRSYPWRDYGITGILLALTHLTKASIMPAILLFLFWRLLALALATRRPTTAGSAWVQNRRPLLGLALMLFCFLAPLTPYLWHSQQIFGAAFYNVNSTFYIWYDSWDEAMQGTLAHGDHFQWPDLPPEEIPGLSRYLQTHTAADMATRLWTGTKIILFVTAMPQYAYGYFKYALLFTIFTSVVLIINRRHLRTRLLSPYRFLLGFLLSHFLLYFLLYAWYTPISSGSRFILSQYIPFMFALSYFLTRLGPEKITQDLAIYRPPLKLFHMLVTMVLLIDLIMIFSSKIGVISGAY